jgi:uncharacterized cofD-like protein
MSKIIKKTCSDSRRRIVCLGGGTGISMVLSGLVDYPFELEAIVTMFDDGGSSGRLAREFNILPPGDVRQCLVATARNKKLAEIFTYRFTAGPQKGHSQGNLLIAKALLDKKGDWDKAIEELRKKLNAKAKIWPVTFGNSKIKAILNNKKEIIGEENIINTREISQAGIKKLFLFPEVKANPKAISAIKKADLIIIGPGKFYTSLLPNLLVKGIPEAIKESLAKKIFICNLMTQEGNTDKLKVGDYVKILEGYLGIDLDFVIYNTARLSAQLMEKVRQVFPNSEFIKYGNNLSADKKFIGADLLDSRLHELNPSDILVKGPNQRTIVFHDSQKLSEILINLCK